MICCIFALCWCFGVKPSLEVASAGLVMQQSSGDNSLHVNLHQKFQLLRQGNVAAFQNSELCRGDSAQSVASLLAAVATASSTKTAEIERLMAESQKV